MALFWTNGKLGKNIETKNSTKHKHNKNKPWIVNKNIFKKPIEL
jgi:hypothetical protein